MANRNTQGFPSPEEDPRFHDTYQFLRRYRDATYSLKVVVHQMEHQFKLQYDNDIDKFLDSIYAAGADLTGSDIEQRAKSIARSNQMLKLLESSITGNAGLRLKHSVPSFGDLLQKRHWIRSTSSFQSNTYRLSSRLFVIS